MPNKRHNDQVAGHTGDQPKTAPNPHGGAGKGPTEVPIRDGTANWPGLPGKAQPSDRGRGGDEKVKIHPKSDGI